MKISSIILRPHSGTVNNIFRPSQIYLFSFDLVYFPSKFTESDSKIFTRNRKKKVPWVPPHVSKLWELFSLRILARYSTHLLFDVLFLYLFNYPSLISSLCLSLYLLYLVLPLLRLIWLQLPSFFTLFFFLFFLYLFIFPPLLLLLLIPCDHLLQPNFFSKLCFHIPRCFQRFLPNSRNIITVNLNFLKRAVGSVFPVECLGFHHIRPSERIWGIRQFSAKCPRRIKRKR